jgi:membrane-bound lytic murein transglycosylase D
MKKTPLIFIVIYLLFSGNSLLSVELCAASDPFPVYPCIEENVDFWTEVYTKYPTTQGIVHDGTNLHIIYEVIELLPPERHGARKTNRKRIRNAKNKYKKILGKLAHSAFASDEEARRVAALFNPNGDPATFRRAMHNIRCQIGQKDRFREGLIRSGAYLDQIKEIFRSHGLPEDLAYLPHVESSFNPRACSKFGAAGVWQFTHSTGKRFMTVGHALDERWAPIRSSEAAAQLLKHSYEKLGSWPMAITAYNHGIKGMLRAKRANSSYEAIFKDYKSRIFRFASRNFYPEFLAARKVAKNYERYFSALELDTPAETREVVLAGYASIEDLSRYFEVDIGTIRRLNPSLRPPVFKEQKYVPKGYALRLPTHVVQGLGGSSAELPQSIYKAGQKPSRSYRVKRGDTVAKIAKMHRLKVFDLVLANNLDSRGTIYVNQNLRLPVPGEKPDLPKNIHGNDKKQKMLKCTDLLASEDQPQPKQAVGLPAQQTPLVSEVRIPASELSVNPTAVADNLQVERVMMQRGKPIGVIHVEIEETLGHYAEWLGIPTHKIRQLNVFPPGRTLRLHQKVKIPLDRVSEEQFEEARFKYHKNIQEDFLSAHKIETVQIYQVKNGDNIWTLCNEVFKVPLWLLKKYNPGINFRELRWSQKLMIPVVEKRSMVVLGM